MTLTVHQLADRADTTSHAVRYYTRIGLLKPDRHPGNGYKLFAYDDVNRLRFIRQAKTLGFTLNEIAEVLHDAQLRTLAMPPRARVDHPPNRREPTPYRRIDRASAAHGSGAVELEQDAGWYTRRAHRLPLDRILRKTRRGRLTC